MKLKYKILSVLLLATTYANYASACEVWAGVEVFDGIETKIMWTFPDDDSGSPHLQGHGLNSDGDNYAVRLVRSQENNVLVEKRSSVKGNECTYTGANDSRVTVSGAVVCTHADKLGKWAVKISQCDK